MDLPGLKPVTAFWNWKLHCSLFISLNLHLPQGTNTTLWARALCRTNANVTKRIFRQANDHVVAVVSAFQAWILAWSITVSRAVCQGWERPLNDGLPKCFLLLTSWFQQILLQWLQRKFFITFLSFANETLTSQLFDCEVSVSWGTERFWDQI